MYLDKLKSIQDDEELSVVQRKQLSDILYQAIDATNQDLTKLKQGDAADAVAPLITAAGARISDVSSVTTGQQKDAMKNTAYIDAAKR